MLALPGPPIPARPHGGLPPAGAYEIFFKRILDIVVVLLMAPFVLPLVFVLGS